MKLFVVLASCLGVMTPLLVAAPGDTVVLLHGLGRTSLSMIRVAHALEAQGYHVVNISYRSRTQPLETLATEWLPRLLHEHPPRQPGARVHFVTHSMGGILVRLWLRECGAPANLGRVVMLAPPNRGSELVDRLSAFPPFRWFTGVNGRRLGTAADALAQQLGAWPGVAGELGIIAGTHSLNPVFATALPRPNDGKVAVASTHLDGARDHLSVRGSHTWLAWQREVLTQIATFLERGTFLRETPAS